MAAAIDRSVALTGPRLVNPPYGVIGRLLRAHRVVPFLGAGASMVGRPVDAKWDAKATFLPSGRDLANLLARESEFPSENENLARVASYFSHIAGRRDLRDRLREVFASRDYAFGALHEFLAAEVPGPLVIVVTNYDTLLEQAFQAAGKPYDVVAYPADRKDVANSVLWWAHGESTPIAVKPNELDIDLTRTTVIFKMHGTVTRTTAEWDNFVITEEDYVEFLSRLTTNTAIPSIFYPYFRERSFLFLGYGLEDWNLRVLLKNLSKHLATQRYAGDDTSEALPSWAIQLKPEPVDERLWQKNNVNIFDCSLDEFVAQMRQRMSG